MDKFKIFETDRFLKDLEQDFSGRQERIKRKLASYVYPQLRQNPYFGKNIKKLTDYKPGASSLCSEQAPQSQFLEWEKRGQIKK